MCAPGLASHGLHKELKVSRVDCVDTVDHTSQTSQGRFRVTRVQTHQTRLDQELLFLLAVANCCIQEVYGILWKIPTLLWLLVAGFGFLQLLGPTTSAESVGGTAGTAGTCGKWM
jgi:hypothetical protein